MLERVRIFVIFSEKDKAALHQLERRISAVLPVDSYEITHRKKVAIGSNRTESTYGLLDAADLVLLLISVDALVDEALLVERALDRRGRDLNVLIPIRWRFQDLKGTLLEQYVALPDSGPPISEVPSSDQIWGQVVSEIQSVVEGLRNPRRVQKPSYPTDERHKPLIDLAERLESLYAKREECVALGEKVDTLDIEILDVRRALRQGPQLHEGEYLIGRFRLLQRLGNGGFATVWKAYDRDHRDIVAVKVLHSQWSKDATRIEQFRRGARQMAKLKAPNVVRVIMEYAEEDGFHFFVMEFIEGGDLRHAVLRKRLPQTQALETIVQVCAALHEAHVRGIVHRDVKPANIILDMAGRAKLTDFDLVRAIDTTGGTPSGLLGGGTFLYASPEAMKSAKDATSQTDIYSIGMTTIFALLGEDLPFDVIRDAPGFIRKLPCSDEIKAVISKAVEWDTKKRYATMAEFCSALASAAKMQTPDLRGISESSGRHSFTSIIRYLFGPDQKLAITLGVGASIAIVVLIMRMGSPQPEKRIPSSNPPGGLNGIPGRDQQAAVLDQSGPSNSLATRKPQETHDSKKPDPLGNGAGKSSRGIKSKKAIDAGGLPPATVTQVMMRAGPELGKCIPTNRDNPTLKVSLSIEPSGRVSTFSSTPANGCVDRVLSGLRFPSFQGAQLQSVTYDYKYTKGQFERRSMDVQNDGEGRIKLR